MKKINVLSLFDGISCAQIALERAGITVGNYYSSEIESHSILVTQHNYPKTIQIGDVRKVRAENLPAIDLLIGGSPCTGFSVMGNMLNFNDHRSKLFFEFSRILNEAKPKYFLLENVNMKREWQEVITAHVGVSPILINSATLTAQSRPRLYWTNIEGVEQPSDKGVLIKDIVDTHTQYEYVHPGKTVNRVYRKNYVQYDINGRGHNSQDQRAYYLDAKHGCLDVSASSKAKIMEADKRVRKTTRIEAERLQGVPDGYTSPIPRSKAMGALGNGFTVDVIAHILSYANFNGGENV